MTSESNTSNRKEHIHDLRKGLTQMCRAQMCTLEDSTLTVTKKQLRKNTCTEATYESLLATISEVNTIHAQFALNRIYFQIRSRSLESCMSLVKAVKGKQDFIITQLPFNSRAVLEA